MKFRKFIGVSFLFISSILSAFGDKECHILTPGRYTGCDYLCEMCESIFDSKDFYFEGNECKNCSGRTVDGKGYKCCMNREVS